MNIGTRVRYIGGQKVYRNVLLLMLLGHTGTIKARSDEPGKDWFVQMDEGCFDLDAQASALEPIADQPEILLSVDEVAA
jgi:hypothetical protein